MTSTQPTVGTRVTFSYPRWGVHFGTVEAVRAHPGFGEPVAHVRTDSDGQVVAFRLDHLREV